MRSTINARIDTVWNAALHLVPLAVALVVAGLVGAQVLDAQAAALAECGANCHLVGPQWPLDIVAVLALAAFVAWIAPKVYHLRPGL